MPHEVLKGGGKAVALVNEYENGTCFGGAESVKSRKGLPVERPAYGAASTRAFNIGSHGSIDPVTLQNHRAVQSLRYCTKTDQAPEGLQVPRTVDACTWYHANYQFLQVAPDALLCPLLSKCQNVMPLDIPRLSLLKRWPAFGT